MTYPHIFTPIDDSLEARVQAYKEVLSAYRHAQASREAGEDSVLRQTLGSLDEIDFAFNVASESLGMALGSFSESEFQAMQKNGMLDQSEMIETIRHQRQAEMNQNRENTSSEQSSFQQK